LPRAAEGIKSEEGKDQQQPQPPMVQLGPTLAVEIPAKLITMASELFDVPGTTPSPSSSSPTNANDANAIVDSSAAPEPMVVDGRLLSPEPGFLHSLLIHHGKVAKGKGQNGEEEGEGALSVDSSSSSSSSSTSSSSGTIICFRFVQHRRLQHENADIRTMLGLSLNECR
jgi:hypothetical protein